MCSFIRRFNIYLRLLLVLGLASAITGCQSSTKKNKEATTLRFHLETNPDGSDRSMQVQVGRSTPFPVNVESSPFLTEIFVVEAKVVDGIAGFEIFLKLDRQGTWLLEQYTTGNIGKRIALFSQFTDSRWLAAPRITKRIGDGTFVFTPDASREEAERIVHGLQMIAKEVKKEEKW